uniref:Uncharacterized protein n=1 Tax=Romanomermis culicivorax TaxID=13658 RepID=A0A915J1B9_ROMCU
MNQLRACPASKLLDEHAKHVRSYARNCLPSVLGENTQNEFARRAETLNKLFMVLVRTKPKIDS